MNIANSDAETLAAALALPNSKLLTLNLTGSDLWNDGLSTIAAVLPNTEITDLDLSSTAFDKDGLQTLSNVLPNTKITKLGIQAVKYIASFDDISSLLNIIPATKLTSLHFSLKGSIEREINKIMKFIACSNISTIINMNKNNVMTDITTFNKLLQEGTTDNDLLLEVCHKLINSNQLDALKGFIATHNIDSNYLIGDQKLFDRLINYNPKIQPLLEAIKAEFIANTINTDELYSECLTSIETAEPGNYYAAVKELLLTKQINVDKIITATNDNQLHFPLSQLLESLNEYIPNSEQASFSTMLKEVRIELAGQIDYKHYTNIDVVFSN